MDPERRSRAGVVGAGIAGLSAAVALRRAGWRVDVFERSRLANEVGAAITVAPNATRVLHHLGFDMVRARPVPNQRCRLLNAATLEPYYQSDYADMEQRMGHGAWSFHRVDLHRGLRDLAVSDDPAHAGQPVALRLGCRVDAVDCDEGVLTLADGTAVQADLVIIADGVHSRLVEDFTRSPDPIRSTGRSVYRWLVPMEEIEADDEVRPCFDGLPGFLAWHDLGTDVFFLIYTCRGGRMANMAVLHDTQAPDQKAGPAAADAWHAPATRDQVLQALANFGTAARRMVAMASEDGIRVHRLFTRPPLDSFVRGRAAIVGDAAHVMLPTQAAGGSIAIESAATLEVLFGGVDGAVADAVADRLRLFDRLRVPRCNLTMLCSNAGHRGLARPGCRDQIRRYYAGPLPPDDAPPWSAPFRSLLFDHDEYAAAEAALSASASASAMAADGRLDQDRAVAEAERCNPVDSSRVSLHSM